MGKNEQGISEPLSVQKTDIRSGIIINNNPPGIKNYLSILISFVMIVIIVITHSKFKNVFHNICLAKSDSKESENTANNLPNTELPSKVILLTNMVIDDKYSMYILFKF